MLLVAAATISFVTLLPLLSHVPGPSFLQSTSPLALLVRLSARSLLPLKHNGAMYEAPPSNVPSRAWAWYLPSSNGCAFVVAGEACILLLHQHSTLFHTRLGISLTNSFGPLLGLIVHLHVLTFLETIPRGLITLNT